MPIGKVYGRRLPSRRLRRIRDDRMQRWLKPLLVTLLLISCAANAHEIGTTQVRFTLHRDHSWSAAIITAPQALVNRLEARAKQPRSSDLDADALRGKL